MQIERHQDAGGGPGRARDFVPATAMTAMFTLVAVSAFLPRTRLWGVDHLAFYPLYLRVTALVLAAAAFLPPVAGGIRRAVTSGIGLLRADGRALRLVAPAAAALTAALCWTLRSSTLLLGDARLVASNFEHAFDPNYRVIVSSARIILLEEPYAKGTGLLYHYAARISVDLFGASPVDGIRLLNCLLGGILVYLLLRLVAKRPANVLLAAWALMAALTSGAVELFFGYVENYAPLIFFGSLYVIYGFVYITRGRARSLAIALGCLAAAVFMHVEGLLLAPSAVLLVYWDLRGRTGLRPLHVTAALVSVVIAGTVVLATMTPYSRHMLPALANAETLGALSPRHFADVGNELLLIMPALPVAAALAFACRRRMGEATAPSPDTGGLHFSLILLAPCMLFLLFFKPDLGMARDWDLFAVIALGLIPLGLTGIRRATIAGGTRRVETLTGPALALSAVLALAWVGINASPDLSARRFEAVLQYDRTRAAYAYEVLAQHYRSGGDLPGAIGVMEKGMSLSYNPRLMSLAAGLYEESGNPDEAVRLYSRVLERQPEIEGTRRNLVLLLYRLGRYDALLKAARDGTRYHPESPVYHYFYGMALIKAGQIDRGVAELETCRRLGPGDEALANIDRALAGLRALGYDVDGGGDSTGFSTPGRE